MTQPSVTVVIPVFNEEENIEACLAAIGAQGYTGRIDIMVVDGGSQDRTLELAARSPGVTVIANPRRNQAAGLNRALEVAEGEILVRVDGHCVIGPDYISRCVSALVLTGAALVGGAMNPIASRGLPAAIATAMRSRLGAGTARFHRADGKAGWVDTVYLGAFRTETARRVGGYDEAFVPNEDAEFAWRMSRLGGVWFDPTIRSTYRPRSTIAALGRQFFRYGRGRAATVATHPSSLSARQLVAPALLVGLATPWRSLVARVYLLGLAGAAVGRSSSLGVRVRLPLVMATMHVTWGLGFLSGLPRALGRSVRAQNPS